MSIIEWEKISTLARASKGAYNSSEITEYVIVSNYNDVETGFSFTVYEHQNRGEYIFAFRGTEISLQDVYADLRLGMPQWTSSIRQKVEDALSAYLSEAGDAIIHFTGHSLGGALAQYAAYEYAIASSQMSQMPPFDLVTFNSLGGVLGLTDPRLYPDGYDAAIASTIDAAHFAIKTDVVSRLGDGHVGGNLRIIDISADSPLSAHALSNFVGGSGREALTVGDYVAASAGSSYLPIRDLVAVSGVYASFGDDGIFTPEEALLRTISAFSFGLSHGDSESLAQLVTAFFGDPSTIGQAQYDAWIFIGARTIEFLQHTTLNISNSVLGAYALAMANTLQWSAQFWEEHPYISQAIGMTVEAYMGGVANPGAQMVRSAWNYAVGNGLVVNEFQEAVDFIENTIEWIERYFPWNSENALYLSGTSANDILMGDGAYWFGKSADDRIYGYDGHDVLDGGLGEDYLFGGEGADRYVWATGDGDDFIGDYDDAGDRIIVNDIDLATLNFERRSTNSPYYADPDRPDLLLHYDGDYLTISIGSGPDAGSITVTQYTPGTGADFGIVLNNYSPEPDPDADVIVAKMGLSNSLGANETDPKAFYRHFFRQRGVDWDSARITFDAVNVPSYTGGALHGTLGGAFEGGPVDDYLAGNPAQNALHGLAGDDRIEGRAGNDLLEGGAGADLIFGGDGEDIIFGSARAGLAMLLDEPTLYDQFYLAQIVDSEDHINILAGDGGNDFVAGGEYTDHVDGGTGADYLLGGTGVDYISGGADGDVIYGDSILEHRSVEVTPGVVGERLEIAFANGIDDVGVYDDVIHGGSGNDMVWGELGDDEIHGESGDDVLVGDRFNSSTYFANELPAFQDTTPDLSAALHGEDKLYGGAGADMLLGVGGDDQLAGGTGNDLLSGGAGDDAYIFNAGDGRDQIQDSEGTHTLVFTGIALSELRVKFIGSQVFVGGASDNGFYLARSEWNDVRVALDTLDSTVERSRLDMQYYDGAGNLLMTVEASHTLSESDRNELFTVDTTNPNKPKIVVKPGVDKVNLEGNADGTEGGRVRIISGGLNFFTELVAQQLETGEDFLSLAEGLFLTISGFSGDITGTSQNDWLIGSGGDDVINALAGDDVLEGNAGNDELSGGIGSDVLLGGVGNDTIDGGSGDDVMRGESGDDVLYGSSTFLERDFFDGGRGSDMLYGGVGSDTYKFAVGDGTDRITDPNGYHAFEFDQGVDPASVVLRYTDATDSRVRIEYGPGDAVVAVGSFSSYWINSVMVGGIARPLLHRSDLVNGTFRDTQWHDIFEPGPGSDTIYVSGFGNDAFRFNLGDGQDVVKVAQDPINMARKGDIRFAAGVDLGAISFDFINADAVISYGSGDKITLDTATVISPRDNTFLRFTVSSESDPGWIPVIRAQGASSNVFGTFGADHIIGGINPKIIIPGYGNDIIEGGSSDDSIILNDPYLPRADSGIGLKQILGRGGNDTVETPLFQGLTFYYNLGDGHDTIDYDWSYSSRHPYLFNVNWEESTAQFLPYGEDTLVFGQGIALADLRFTRFGDALAIQHVDGLGSIRVNDFFHAWDAEASSAPGSDLFTLMHDSYHPDVDSLLDPVVLSALPRSPLATLRFADGTVFDMASGLGAMLEVVNATVLGTEGDDQIYGTDVDQIIYSLGGNDYIDDPDGSNIIDAGSGDDSILVTGTHTIDTGSGNDEIRATGDNRIDAGPGDDRLYLSGNNIVKGGAGFDRVTLRGGHNVLQFGPGDGYDIVSFTVQSGVDSTILEMAAGLTVADIRVERYVDGSSDFVEIILPATGDVISPQAMIANAQGTVYSPHPHATFTEVRFSDGTVISGEALFAMASDGPIVIEGTDGNDLLTGTDADEDFIGGRGNDTLRGEGGSDYFFVEGHDQGADRIIGGGGYDVILGGDRDDTITLVAMTPADSIEEIDGGMGLNIVRGTAANNNLNFSATKLVGIHHIDGAAGNDDIRGSQGANIIIGGVGNDSLRGMGGNDLYLSGRHHGRDQIGNYDPTSADYDVMWIFDVAYKDIWLSQSGYNLLINVVGTNDQVEITNWYFTEHHQLDAIYAADRVLWRNQVDQLVNAMASFNVPSGAGAVIPQAVQSALEPTLAAVWHQAA